MFNQSDRTELRQLFFDVWHKYQTKQVLQPLEKQVLHVMLQHPEYKVYFAQEERYLQQDFSNSDPNGNPFLHLALHQAIIEQISTDRPAGITAIYQRLTIDCGDKHAVEHQMMDILAETLWQSMQQQQAPDEKIYLARLRQLFKH
jgi:hypothetical protein